MIDPQHVEIKLAAVLWKVSQPTCWFTKMTAYVCSIDKLVQLWQCPNSLMVGFWYAPGCACMCREAVTPLPTFLSVYTLSASVVKAGEPVCQGKNNTSMHNPLACTRGIRAQNAATSILNVLMHFFSFIMLSHVQKHYGLVMWHQLLSIVIKYITIVL